jgi:molybdopterin converting factor small subunit
MPIKVFLSSTLRRSVSGYDPVKGFDLTESREITVKDLCKKINVPVNNVKIVIIDGKIESTDYILKGNERVGLFPPLGGG